MMRGWDDHDAKRPPESFAAGFAARDLEFEGWPVGEEKNVGLDDRDGLNRQARNPGEVPDAGPKVENAQAFQEGITGGQTSHRQVGMPRDIVERLRDQGRDAFARQYSLGMFKLCIEAADEIERLRAAALPQS